jgi:hypothetical protein
LKTLEASTFAEHGYLEPNLHAVQLKACDNSSGICLSVEMKEKVTEPVEGVSTGAAVLWE